MTDQQLIDRATTQAAREAGAKDIRAVAALVRAEARVNPESGNPYVVAIHETGEATSVLGAVQRLKDSRPTLFNGNAPAANETPKTLVDVSKLDHQTYRKLRAESPQSVGLTSRYTTGRRR